MASSIQISLHLVSVVLVVYLLPPAGHRLPVADMRFERSFKFRVRKVGKVVTAISYKNEITFRDRTHTHITGVIKIRENRLYR